MPGRFRDPATFPPYLYEAYRATVRRSPHRPLAALPPTLSEATGPGPAVSALAIDDDDLTRNAGTGGEAIGERIIVTGRVLGEYGNPVPPTLVEIWQANAAGRYRHRNDQHHAPLDPNFRGLGRCRTDTNGVYRFLTIRPGAYPWENHENAWRPPHIHFSLLGPSWLSRLVTQMYFPGDPLLELDPIFNSVPSEAARARLVARYAHDVTEPGWALGYRFDIVLRGPHATPGEPLESADVAPSQTLGPFFHAGLLPQALQVLVTPETAGEPIRIEGCVYDGDGAPVPDAVVEIWQANPHGRYHHPADRRGVPLDPAFIGFGRAGVDEAGFYWFETIKPGPVPFDETTDQAPHINVVVFARGLLNRLATRVYFADDRANDTDPVLHRVPPGRRPTLLARRMPREGKAVYRFDIVLQGERETVFFNFGP